jgi:hypothetical protein
MKRNIPTAHCKRGVEEIQNLSQIVKTQGVKVLFKGYNITKSDAPTHDLTHVYCSYLGEKDVEAPEDEEAAGSGSQAGGEVDDECEQCGIDERKW